MDVIGFSIASPLWLVLPALIWLVERLATSKGLLAKRGLPGAWSSLVEPVMVPTNARFVRQSQAGTTRGLLYAIAACLAFALADISYGNASHPNTRNLAGRVIIADLGQKDTNVRAQQITIASLLASASDAGEPVPTALIVVSRDSFEVVPLTADYRQIERYLAVLDPALMPVEGRHLPPVFERAEAMLTRANTRFGQTILVTEGAAPAHLQMPQTGPRQRTAHLTRVIIHNGNEDADAWNALASRLDAVRLGPNEIESANDLLDEAVAQGLADTITENAADNRDQWRLRPLFAAMAGLCWLGLFRREAA